jgi:branched-chain amino acid transport system permease protein
LAIAPARGASVVTLIIITIGASIFLRGARELVSGASDFPALPAFSGSEADRHRRRHACCRRACG